MIQNFLFLLLQPFLANYAYLVVQVPIITVIT